MQPIVRHGTQQSLVALIEMIGGAYLTRGTDIGADVVGSVVAVSDSAPAKVEVEIDLTVAVLIAVADEAMAALGCHTAVHDGVAQLQLGLEAVGPAGIGVAVGLEDTAHLAAVVKIVLQRVVDTGIAGLPHQAGGSTTLRTVAHMQTNAYVVKQGRDGHLLFLRAGEQHLIRHVLPVIQRMGKIGRLCPKGGTVVGLVAKTEGRVVPVAHHLPLGGGSTAHGGVLGGKEGIALVLVPVGLDKRGHGVALVARLAHDTQCELLPGTGIGCAGRHTLLHRSGNMGTVGIHACLQLQGQGLGRNAVGERIGYHRTCAVVCREHHETAFRTHKKIHLVVLPVDGLQESFAMQDRLPEMVCHPFGIIGRNRLGHNTECSKRENNQK